MNPQLNHHHNDNSPCLEALDNAPVPMTILREDGRFLLINRAAQAFLGYTSAEIPTLNEWADLVQDDDSAVVKRRLIHLFTPKTTFSQTRTTLKAKNGQTLTWDIYTAPFGHAPDGERLLLTIARDVSRHENRNQCFENLPLSWEQEISGNAAAFKETIHALENEISERKCMEEALKLSRERVKHLSMKILDALEADRRAVSKELHDSIGASLAAIKFSLEEKELNREKNHDRPRESLDQEIAYLLSTIKETKRLSAKLRPSTLDDLGLIATIKWYLRQFRQAHKNVDVHFTTDVTEDDVPEPMKIILYRIVQEGIGNVEKHSGADNVCLHLGFADGNRTVFLDIEDDGGGFDVAEVLSQKDPIRGSGLIAMRERCEIFGGSFHINSGLGRGTKIHVMLPR